MKIFIYINMKDFHILNDINRFTNKHKRGTDNIIDKIYLSGKNIKDICSSEKNIDKRINYYKSISDL